MSLSPALQGFLLARQQVQQQDSQDLQQAGSLVALRSAIEKQRVATQETGRNEALRAAIEALPPDQRTRENVLPLLMRFGNVKEMVPLLKSAEKAYQPIGAGGVLDTGTGEVTPPAARPEAPPLPTTLSRLMAEKAKLPPGDTRHAIYDAAIRKESETAKQITPPPPAAAVTTAEVIDPTDPTRMLKVDARTYKGGSIGSPGVIGVSGNVGAREKLNMKRQFNMQGIGKVIQDAEDILSGKNGDALPTQSGVGTGVDYLASLVGATPSGAPQADRLRAIGGALTAKMPRMEGPQSDRDVVLYREMAARVGDSTIPVSRRTAALDTVKELWSKYENLNPDAFAGASPQGATPPGATPGAAAPAGAPAGFREGQTATGPGGQKIVFKGGQWVPAGR